MKNKVEIDRETFTDYCATLEFENSLILDRDTAIEFCKQYITWFAENRITELRPEYFGSLAENMACNVEWILEHKNLARVELTTNRMAWDGFGVGEIDEDDYDFIKKIEDRVVDYGIDYRMTDDEIIDFNEKLIKRLQDNLDSFKESVRENGND